MSITHVSRRQFILSSIAIAASASKAFAQPQPWQAQFISGSFDGATYQAGLHVTLEPKWKTYWRVPGSGGVPPSITLSGSNLKSFTFDCPVPKRFQGEEGETIGYKDEVVFPIHIEPMNASLPVDVTASAFIGVCDTICIPVPLEQALKFLPVSASQPNDMLLKQWQLKVPRLSPETIVTSTKLMDQSLVLQLVKPADEIFVEGPSTLSFSAPKIESSTATMHINGLKSSNDLIGKSMKLTLVASSEGLEQVVTVV
jgi:DsbC/DsbD-like thiol-disulfide interchange protein